MLGSGLRVRHSVPTRKECFSEEPRGEGREEEARQLELELTFPFLSPLALRKWTAVHRETISGACLASFRP